MLSERNRPWMTAMEMQFATMKFLSAAYEHSGLKRFKSFYRFHNPILKVAETFAWTRETVSAVTMASRTVPLTTQLIRSSIPFDFAWWWLGDNGHLFATDFDNEWIPVRALLLAKGRREDDREGIFVSLFVSVVDDAPKALHPVSRFFWAYRESVEDVIQRQADDIETNPVLSKIENGRSRALEVVSNSTRFIAAALAWLQQRIVTMNAGHIERHLRKQLLREHNVTTSDVKVIQLRRSESTPRAGSQESGDLIDWSCRWIVNGHWRNQPYADGEHKLIYILPYVKGPDDKPLKVPKQTVYEVSR